MLGPLSLKQIFIFPIKSLGGIQLSSVEVKYHGLEYDRNWMLVDNNGQFITQRKYPKLALYRVKLTTNDLLVTSLQSGKEIQIPLEHQAGTPIPVTVWDSSCMGVKASAEINDWFSKELELKVSLVRIPRNPDRKINEGYAQKEEKVSFADGFPILIVSQESLDDLNSKLEEELPMNRFRANLVFEGGDAFFEDQLALFKIGNIQFKGVKPCVRCVLTTVDQETGIRGAEPLLTLSKYRKSGNKIYFGQNLIPQNLGMIKLGDKLAVEKLGTPPL